MSDDVQPCPLCDGGGRVRWAGKGWEPAGLDVERLARAIERAGYGDVTGDLDQYQEWGGTPREVAEAIAREYAALAETPGEPREGTT